MSDETNDRQVYGLLAYSAKTGAATTCVGVLGVDPGNGVDAEMVVQFVPGLMENEDGGWPERVAAAQTTVGQIPPGAIDAWLEQANGVVWDIEPAGAADQGSTLLLADMVDRIVDELLVNPDPDPRVIDGVRS
jgi:hypothetical protein